jgi:putative tryptophan/tyrosine transport system substrate-binding protein
MNPAGRTNLLLLKVFLIGVMLCLFSGHDTLAKKSPLIISLSSQHSKPYLQVIEGFEKEVMATFPETKFIRYLLQKHAEENSKIFQEINEKNPFLLLTAGSKATRAGLKSIPDVPLVAVMILNEQILTQSPRATGVLLRYPSEVHIQWLRHFLPDADRIAMLYNPQENEQLIAGMKKTAEQFGIKIDAMPVTSVKQLPPALKSLGRKADMLLGMPDKTVYSGETAKAILLSSFRNRIPFAGISSPWVKAGALYALTWDYMDLGRQCGLIAGRILTGTAVADIAPVTPEKVCYEVNLKTADHLRLTLNPALIQGATKVYK